MIDRVYLIGAGASVPYGLPTMKTLTWELAQSLDETDSSIFVAAIRDCFGKNLEKPEDSPDFEELLNRLDPLALLYLEDSGLGGPDSSPRKAAEIALSGLRAFIQNRCSVVATQEGPLDVLGRSIDKTTLLVSFNWDILLELALLRAGRNYCYLPSKHAGDSVVLLKPHGSINWFALLDRELLKISPESNLGVIGDDLNNYLCYLREPLHPVNFSACSPFVQHALSSVPAIVPPTASKLLSVGGTPRDGFVEAGHMRAMKTIWGTIVNAFTEAREIVVIGYSLPGTDAASIEALKHFAASYAARNPKQILIVDPNPALADRYRSVLGIDAKVICSDFCEFKP
jgi:hypothetical protein